MPDPKLKSSITPNYEAQLRALKERARGNSQAIPAANWSGYSWTMPEGGAALNLFDIASLSSPFDRDAANLLMVEALNPEDGVPGMAADSVITVTQVDYLALMERAFRNRHTMRRTRAALHATSRWAGHGSDSGVFVRCGLEYLRGMMLRATS